MANREKSLQKYFRNVDRANAEVHGRWTQVRGHLRYGLGFPIPTASILYKRFEPPHDFPGVDGRLHRKPVRALYGIGRTAGEGYERDLAAYNMHAAALRSDVDRYNGAVDMWVRRAQAGEHQAVRWYCESMLPAVLPTIPGGSAKYLITGYSAADRHLVVERYVPGLSVIPLVDHYEIGRDLSLRTVDTPERDRRVAYMQVLAQVALLTLDRVFRCEIYKIVDVSTVNLVTVMQNPATGHQDVVCLLSLSAQRARFWTLNLLGVDPVVCAQDLGARMTRQPGEYSPIDPWVKSDHGDVVISVSDVPLLKMNPYDFERLVTQLLQKIGLRAKTTGQSGDGGIDCEAYDDRPVVGGKVIVQVKRYTGTVPPSVVRDLFGTVHASGATKGVLVTTSGFGPESRQFAEGKPLELIDGVQLEALLRQHDLGSTMASEPIDSRKALQGAAPQVSPDGNYYWDGAAWQLIAKSNDK